MEGIAGTGSPRRGLPAALGYWRVSWTSCLSNAIHQTDDKVERFNGRIFDLVKQTRFASIAKIETARTFYLNTYNHQIARRDLKYQTPIWALPKWRADKPDFFGKRV